MSILTTNGSDMNTSLTLEETGESFVILPPSMAPDYKESSPCVNNVMLTSNLSLYSTPPSMDLSQAMGTLSMSASSELCSEEVQTQMNSILQENLHLKETLHQNNLAMKKQYKTLETWQEDVKKVHESHKEKFEATKILIAKLQTENTELKKQITNLSGSMNASLKSFTDTENVNLKSKISALEFELGTLREGYLKKETEQNLKITELETKLANVEKESETQITRLNRDLSELNIELNATKEKLAVAQNRVVELADKVPTVDQVATIEKMSKEITELSSELEYKNIVLQKKSEEFDNLLEENKKLQEENKCIPIYKTQVEVYQADFKVEQEQRLLQQQEKDRIATDLHLLQRRNQELINDLERAREGNHMASSSQSSPPREDSEYICPKCNYLFPTYITLEKHVYRCIELEDS